VHSEKSDDEEKYLGNAASVSRGQWKPDAGVLGKEHFRAAI